MADMQHCYTILNQMSPYKLLTQFSMVSYNMILVKRLSTTKLAMLTLKT